jgi:hypothetical protein
MIKTVFKNGCKDADNFAQLKELFQLCNTFSLMAYYLLM